MPRFLFLVLFLASSLFGVNKCLSCHEGIEHIRSESSLMMKAILEVSDKAGHAGNDCIVCHGGNPTTKNKKRAHSGTVKYFKEHKGPKDFYAAPGSPLVNQNTCGLCHQEQVNAQMNSLMMSSSGKIQATLSSFHAKNNFKHNVANFSTKNPDNPQQRLGSKSYKKYMQKLSSLEPQVFENNMSQLPDAPTLEELEKDPSLAVYTYLRQELLRNHTGLKGCASCHIPYAKDGLYKGNDKSISKKKPGHLLVHSMQSSREVKVKVEDVEHSGVSVESCASCHSEGKSTALSYQGLLKMQNSDETDKYLHMKSDIHFQKGMLCQDCHTSNDMHGDGFISGANLAAVEIECQDCHGTTKAYPWELPLGYSDEFNTTTQIAKARGTTLTIADYLKKGSVNEPRDGYLLSARGNPLVHALKDGDEVLLHLANGKDIKLKPLKKLKQTKKLSQKALLAMDSIESHTDNLECYACHASWAPQAFAQSVTIDYSAKKKNLDYLKNYLVAGSVSKTTGFLRWEEPALSQNGEGRVSPTVPSHQTSFTVIGKDKKVLLETKLDTNSTSMSSTQPHTITKESRDCESCHTSQKAMGYGIGGLEDDYSKFVEKNSTQVQRVGTHFKLSGSLNQAQRDKLDRSGTCIACHTDIPRGSLAVSAMTHMAQMLDVNVNSKMHTEIVNKSINMAAWLQVLAILAFALLIIWVVYVNFIKKKPINPRNKGWK